jgi:hypothetical protein
LEALMVISRLVPQLGMNSNGHSPDDCGFLG